MKIFGVAMVEDPMNVWRSTHGQVNISLRLQPGYDDRWELIVYLLGFQPIIVGRGETSNDAIEDAAMSLHPVVLEVFVEMKKIQDTVRAAAGYEKP